MNIACTGVCPWAGVMRADESIDRGPMSLSKSPPGPASGDRGAGAPGSAPAYRYWAFVSYSSRDAAWARWLHRAIEGYGVPAQMAHHRTPTGEPAPRRLHPVFRDRDELAASSDLGKSIKEALRASRFLIVICSPHAAASEWVNREILAFRAMGRPNHVLAIIVDGRPRSGDASECYPPALLEIEPLAADARKTGDGVRDSKLKVLAGMLGVGFDALKRRDTQRRVRRMQLALTFALVLVAGFASLAWYSNQQRLSAVEARRRADEQRQAAVEARRQADEQRDRAVAARRQAENVLEYLLYDLRDKLEPVGRLDIVADVQQRVEKYYRAMGIAEGDPATLRNRVTAYINDGDRLVPEGHLPQALAAYKAALNMAERLVAAYPNSAADDLLAASHRKIGDVMVAQGDRAAALAAYQKALGIAKPLLATDPKNPTWQRAMTETLRRVGNAQVAGGDLAAAVKTYTEARKIAMGMASSESNNANINDLATAQMTLGDALVARGEAAMAIDCYQQAIFARQALAMLEPNNATFERNLAECHTKLAQLQAGAGDAAGALESFHASRGIYERLAASDPINAKTQQDLAAAHDNIGDILANKGDVKAALESYQAAVSIRQRLAKTDPSNTDWQYALSVSDGKIGLILTLHERMDAAGESFRAAAAIVEGLLKSDPGNAVWRNALARDLGAIGHILLAQGDYPGALESYRRAIEIGGPAAADNVEWQESLAQTHDMVGAAHKSRGNGVAALEAYRAALEIRQRMARKLPDDTRWQGLIATSQEKIGDVHADRDVFSAADEAYRAAIEIRERLAKSAANDGEVQRALWADYIRMAALREREGSGEALQWYRKAYDQLAQMKQRGLLKSDDEPHLKTLKAKLATP